MECAARLSAVEWVTYVSRYVPSFARERQRLRPLAGEEGQRRARGRTGAVRCCSRGEGKRRRTVRYRPRSLILPVCSCTCNLRAYISLSLSARPSRFAGPARASALQLIKPARNLYRHYTLFCVQKAFTARLAFSFSLSLSLPISFSPTPSLAQAARTNVRRGRFSAARDRCGHKNPI